MHVLGKDAQGRSVSRRWFLKADANRGPNVPVLAALAMLRRYRDGLRPEPGARACSGMLSLADFAQDFEALDMERQTLDERHEGTRPNKPPSLALPEAAWQ